MSHQLTFLLREVDEKLDRALRACAALRASGQTPPVALTRRIQQLERTLAHLSIRVHVLLDGQVASPTIVWWVRGEC